MTDVKGRIRAGIFDAWQGDCAIEWHETIGSTNQHLREYLAQADTTIPRVCAARYQHTGVGRRGNRWHAPKESLLFSVSRVFNKKPARLMGLSLVAGLAVVESLRQLESPVAGLGLKWPNDVLLNGRKLAGILVEIVPVARESTGSDPTIRSDHCTAVTGIGLNVQAGTEHQHIDQPYALLEDALSRLPDPRWLTGLIGGNLLAHYQVFENEGWPAFAERWLAHDVLQGRLVSVLVGDQTIKGIAREPAADGGLVVETATGTRTFYSGEVSVRFDQHNC